MDYLALADPLQLQLDRSIDGLYSLEKNCGTASNSLHRRIEPAQDNPVYLFLDPTRSGQAEDDAFVFADNCDRLEYGDHRDLLASLGKKWRPYKAAGKVAKAQDAAQESKEGEPDKLAEDIAAARKQTVSIQVTSYWSALDSSKIVHRTGQPDSLFSTLSTTFDLKADERACNSADCLLSAEVKQTAPSQDIVWARSDWHEVDLHHEGPDVFSKIAWMLAKIPEWDAFREWQAVSSDVRLSAPRAEQWS